jgi:hypothetical protein
LDELCQEFLQDSSDVAYDDSSQVCIVCGTIGHGAISNGTNARHLVDDKELQERLEELCSGNNRGVQPGDLERLDELCQEFLQDSSDVAYDDSSQVCIVCGTIGHGAISVRNVIHGFQAAVHTLSILSTESSCIGIPSVCSASLSGAGVG